jgi:hypothetical protein
MIGAASIGSFYCGFEPCTKTYKGLIELGKFLKQFKTGFDFELYNLPFEDTILDKTYDMALTSPPYYNTEIYSDEETNSCNRYKTFDSWCNGFYIPMIEKTLKHSKIFIINIGSRTYPLKEKLLSYFPHAIEIKSLLSGAGGLGKTSEGKESFFILKN